MDDKHAGLLCVLLASIMWALEPVFAKLSYKNSNFFQTSLIRAIFAFIIFISYEILKSSIRIANIYQPLIGIIVGTGTILYYEELNRLKAVQVPSLELFTPFFASLLAFLF